MSFTEALDIANYGLIFLYGTFLSLSISEGPGSRRGRTVLLTVSPVFLLLQGASLLLLGVEPTRRLYPFLTHIPLLVLLVFVLKRPFGTSLVSVCIAYLCCQLPRCGEIAITAVTGSRLYGEIIFTLSIPSVLLLLEMYFVPSAREAMAESRRSLVLFGSLPVAFYVSSYFSLYFSDIFRYGEEVVAEMFPTLLGLFYMIYTTAYRQQLRRGAQAELMNSMMGGQLRQAENDMASLRQAEAQSAGYQHDMRHHLAVIDGLLDIGKPEKAKEYIRGVRKDIESITPKRFCENELVNLLCSSFSAKAERMGVRLDLEASLPGKLAVSDTELCALISNGLENALNAVSELKEGRRWVELYCGVNLDKLLIEVKNPYANRVFFRDGLPTSKRLGHGYGCQSIYTIAQRRRGLCEFKTDNGIFIMRVALPMQ